MIRYWDLDGGGCLATLAGHTNEVGSVCISPDGRRGLSGSWDKSILYWDLETGRCLRKLKGHSRLVYSICFSPDGRRALSGGGNTARLWDLESGRCLSTLAGYYSTVLSVCFSPDGRLAMSGCNDKANRLWEIVDGNRFQQPLAISKPKGHRELTRKEVDCQLRLKEIDELIETKRHEKAWHRLKRLWMEEHLISDRQGLERYPLLCANGKTIGLVSVREHCILAGHDGEVLCVDISPCGSQAVSGSKDKTLRLWDLQTGSCKATFQEHADTVDTVCFSPDGLHVLSGSADKTLRFYDLEAGSCQAVLKGHENFVKSAAISHDGRYAISASFDKTLRLWDLETARCRLVLTGHTSAVSSVRLSRDGRHAISGGFDKTLRYWDLANGVCLATMNTPSLVFSVSMHPNGRQAMSLDYRGNLSSWDISSGKCLATIDVQNGDSNVLSISPDGRHVITGGWPKPLCVWDMESRQCISNLKAHHNAVNSVCFSPDGNSIYTASADKTIKGWQVVWELDFPSPVDWDETVRPYLHAFLNLRRGRWSEPDFELLLKELAEQRGLGWVRAEGIRTELQKMTAAWQDAGDRNTASAQLEAELSDRTPGEDAHQGNVTNDSQDKTPNTIAEEEEMTQPMVQPESVSLASIKDLFERAFFTVADHDTFLVVQEQGRNVNYLLQLPNNNCLRLQVVFQTREPRPGSRLELVNRINQEMLALRACFAEPHIILDWYIPLDGGITETNIVKSFKFFQLLCNNALQFDTEGVFS
jgi:WD40 repeat protein